MTTENIDLVHEPGRIDNLNAEQEQKLKEMWAQILIFIGELPPDLKASPSVLSSHSVDSKKKKKKRGFLGLRSGSDSKKADKPDDLGKAFRDVVGTMTGEEVADVLFHMLKSDHPDNLLLRFMRARKWVVKDALHMLGNTIAWRKTLDVNNILYTGERVAVETKDEEFLLQARSKKSYIWGHDFRGRPIVHIKTYNHDPKAQGEESMIRFTVFIMETARLCMKDPVDTAAVFFDLSKFSMSNMDYGPVKFMIEAFEKHYPESLGFLLIHNAPWMFQGIWNVIKGWIDPVVASKIKFTKNFDDVSKYIPKEYIEKNLGGQSEHAYEFIEPKEGENALMKDTEKAEAFEKERLALRTDYVNATIDWIKSEDKTTNQAAQSSKDMIAAKLATNYWESDPYIRSRSVFDRNGCISDFRTLHTNTTDWK